MPELVFFRRGAEVLRVALERPRVVLGRGEGCDVVLPDPQVSRQHVALVEDGPRWLLEDLSGHGTRVGDKPLKHGELNDGAALELGPWVAVFRQHSSSGAAAAPTQPGRTDVQPREAEEDARPAAQVRIQQGTTEFLYPIESDSFTVGKDPANSLVVRDSFISSRHLQVTRRGAGFHVRDLNSTNGTYLGDVRVFEVEVPLNTVLRVGETELLFEPALQGQQVPSFHGLVGNEPAMRHLVESLKRVGPSDAGVLILGESGTGKELVARALHAASPRADKPFLSINCGALPPNIIESELFGHEKGAFTGAGARRRGAFEEAHGGTLFLDEVGELPLELQARLLRVLDSGEVKPVGNSRAFHVDVRVVAATHRDLRARVGQGLFREDLYYRLNVLPVGVPPLRSRRTDIRLLAEHFIRQYVPQGQVKLTDAALARLQQHPWPGNVRELRNVVCRALLVRKGPQLDASALTFEEPLPRPPQPGAPLELPEGVTLEQMMQRLERQLIESTLRRCGNHKDRAAKQLGLARSSLFKKLKDWGLGQGDE